MTPFTLYRLLMTGSTLLRFLIGFFFGSLRSLVSREPVVLSWWPRASMTRGRLWMSWSLRSAGKSFFPPRRLSSDRRRWLLGVGEEPRDFYYLVETRKIIASCILRKYQHIPFASCQGEFISYFLISIIEKGHTPYIYKHSNLIRLFSSIFRSKSFRSYLL